MDWGAVIFLAGVAIVLGVLTGAMWDAWRASGEVVRAEARPGEGSAARRSRYVSAETKLAVFIRDGGRCVVCGRGKGDGVSLTVDHIIPWSEGGANTAQNLQTLCEGCNAEKSNRLAMPAYREAAD